MKKLKLSTLVRVFALLILVMSIALLVIVDKTMDDKTFLNAYLYVSGILVCLIIGAVIVHEIDIHSNTDDDEKTKD